MNDSTGGIDGIGPRPVALDVQPQNIPPELKQIPHWVVWRYSQKDGKWTKPPLRVDGNGLASSTNPATWDEFAPAWKVYQSGSVDGVGIVLTADMEIVGLDLDHCRNAKTKTVEPWAVSIIEHFNSYTEASPSGAGVRIFLKGKLPGAGRKSMNVEIYASGRYLTVTGHSIGDHGIERRQAEIDAFLAKYFPESKLHHKPSNRKSQNIYSDDELIDRALTANNGGKFHRLFIEGNIADYGDDDSAADLALCSILAFWTQDRTQIDRIFRRSRLMREKWDSLRGDSTYGELTIVKALQSQTEHHNPNPKSHSTGTENTKTAGGQKRDKPESQADLLVKIAIESGADFFHTPTDEQFITFSSGSHRENWAIRSRAARRWITNKFYTATGKAPNSEAMHSALNVLEARAACDGEQQEVYLRAGWHDGAIYYDLADKEWRVVKIDHNGWEIVDESPLPFRRYSNNLAQSEPERGGHLSAIWDFINIKNDRDRRLVIYWLITAFIPDIPRPMLVTHGDQGATKSTACKVLLSLVDPSATPCLRTKDGGELVQGLAHRFATVLDNVSSLPVWLSDLLCCAITGDGFTKRQLFTDDDDFIYSYRRALLFNGINVAISKPDLLDRSLLIQLERPDNSTRRKEQELWKGFFLKRPHILGAIFDRLSIAIRNYDRVEVTGLPRMADFAQWAMAASNATEFLADYNVNVSRQNSEAIAESVVATVLLNWLTGKKEWAGRPHELHAQLKNHLSSMQIDGKQFPAAPAWLTRKLKEIRPNLSALGWDLHFAPTGDRTITITGREIGSDTAPIAAAAQSKQKQAPSLSGKPDDLCGSGDKKVEYCIELSTQKDEFCGGKGDSGSIHTPFSSGDILNQPAPWETDDNG